MTKEEYTKNILDMVYDINPVEISSHVENDSLKKWCDSWQKAMYTKVAMINLVDGKGE